MGMWLKVSGWKYLYKIIDDLEKYHVFVITDILWTFQIKLIMIETDIKFSNAVWKNDTTNTFSNIKFDHNNKFGPALSIIALAPYNSSCGFKNACRDLKMLHILLCIKL